MSVPSWGFNLPKSRRRGHSRTLGLSGGQELGFGKGKARAKDGGGEGLRARLAEPHLKYWMPTISHQARARSTARPSGSVHWREAASVSVPHTPHAQRLPGTPGSHLA